MEPVAPSSPSATDIKKREPRRAATPRAATQQSKRRNPLSFFVILLLGVILGGLLGGMVVRQRYQQRNKEVMVAVNGTVIPKDQFYHRLEMAAGAQVMKQMVGEELSMQFAKKQGIDPTEAQIDAKYAEASKQKDFEANLARSGQSKEDFRRAIRLNLIQTTGLSKDVNVTEEEIQKFYNTNIDKKNVNARYYTPETVRIAVIVTKTEADAQKAAAEIEKGISFAEVAKKYSLDASKANGGVLPPTQRGRTKSKDIAGLDELIFGLKIGVPTGPRNFAGAWWIIQCLDKRPATTRKFEEVKEECRTGALLTKGVPVNSKKIQDQFLEFQKAANIQAFAKQYEEAVKVTK